MKPTGDASRPGSPAHRSAGYDGAIAMKSIAVVADVLYREEVVRARRMAPEDKLLEGPRLYERACRVMCDGIRHRHPDLDEAGVQALLRAHLDRVSSLEQS
jgi:hypothetical protein